MLSSVLTPAGCTTGATTIEAAIRSILLIEDNPADALLLRQALVSHQVDDEITVLEDGEEALAVIDAADRGERTMPRLVLLDLNLPRIDGFAVLRSIRSREQWAQVPVIILSSSCWEKDIRECRELGATMYKQKPIDLTGLMDLGKELTAMLAAQMV